MHARRTGTHFGRTVNRFLTSKFERFLPTAVLAASPSMDTANFENSLRSEGYQEIETKELPARTHNEEHDHPFDVRALVLEGRISLSVAGATRTYAAGEVFTMAAGCKHAEQAGTNGVRYLVGR